MVLRKSGLLTHGSVAVLLRTLALLVVVLLHHALQERLGQLKGLGGEGGEGHGREQIG